MADLAYSVRRSDRARRARLTVTADGEAVVVLPRRAPAGLAEELVAAHAGWLERQLSRSRASRERLADRPALTGGRLLSVAGTPYRVVVSAAPAPARAVRARVVARPPVVPSEPGSLEIHLGSSGRPAAEILEAWLRREARRVLTERVGALAPVVGVPVPVLTIRAQRSRWGSASRGGRLSLNWRLILAPLSVLDYVVVHELAHLKVPGHSARFWSLVRRHAPNADAARAWLRAHHAELLAALD
ncbi:MAG: hypothetical protein QOH61_351 [Chloroflexota bacterium]|jgi:predicted metal-dependent hydrolase|nr:hypothetical protein [Chloroflexota bacterium]